MLKSMTGFGQATGDFEKFAIKAEFKALNGKFLDLSFRMPRLLQSKEAEIRSRLAKRLERGTVTLSVTLDLKNAADLLQPLNKDVVNFYLKETSQIEEASGMAKGTLTGTVFNIPNALQITEQELSEAQWAQINQVFEEALNQFDNFRIQEGKETEKEIQLLVARIESLCDEVGEMEADRMNGIRQKIKTDLENMVGEEGYDPNRFEQELLYYIEKLDISEEKLRLKNHCGYFIQTAAEDSSGKKLGFIAQEMGREINTMGSKANYFPIQKKIVEMKDELEKIKEQLNNII